MQRPAFEQIKFFWQSAVVRHSAPGGFFFDWQPDAESASKATRVARRAARRLDRS
jgi:hypothetical protein